MYETQKCRSFENQTYKSPARQVLEVRHRFAANTQCSRPATLGKKTLKRVYQSYIPVITTYSY